METVGKTANELTQTFSQNQPISTPTTTSSLSRKQHAALFAVINKSRMLNGWATRTAAELDQTIRTWAEMLNHYRIPIAAYPELYQRAFDVRQQRMQANGDVPQMDATLIVSQWTGPFGLQAAIRQREVDAGRTLPANAETVCQYCLGTGFRAIYRESVKIGVRKCDHMEQI